MKHYIREYQVIAKFIRYTLTAIVLLVVIAVAAVAVTLFAIDPNTYKGQLERLAESNSRVDLSLAGDMRWSLQPLGFELNQVSATLDGQDLLTLDSVVAKADLWSILRLQPRIETFVLRGLNTTLEMDEQGQGNWQRIIDANGTEAPTAATTESAPTSAELQFNLREVIIENARVHYSDRRTGQSLLLDELNVTATDSGFDKPFPLQLAFRFANADVGVRADFSTQVQIDAGMQNIALQGLKGTAEISGAALNHKTVDARIAANINSDFEQQTANIDGLELQFANLLLRGSINASQWETDLQVDGNLDVPGFSARQLLTTLGQALPQTSDPTVLNQLSLSTPVSLTANTLKLSPLKLGLDSTTFNGELSYGLNDGKLNASLDGTAINLDRYLPPAAEGETQTPPAGGDATEEAELLPLQTLREQRWQLRLSLKQVIANHLTLSDFEMKSTAADGLIQLKPVSARLYEGQLQLSAAINARSDTPQWQLDTNIEGVQTQPLLKDAAELDMLSGPASVNASIRSKGNTVSALRAQAAGTAELNMAEGVINGVGATAMACQGIALVHKETIDTQTWPKTTAFRELTGKLVIDGNTVRNTALSATVDGLNLGGSGTVDLDKLMLDYRAGMSITGPVHEHPSCRINDKLMGLRIPAKCRGPLIPEDGEDSPALCKFDSVAFRETIKDMAEAEFKRKAQEKAEQKIDKMLGTDGAEGADPRKEAIKGLFKEMLKK